jgi:hypothetical protein
LLPFVAVANHHESGVLGAQRRAQALRSPGMGLRNRARRGFKDARLRLVDAYEGTPADMDGAYIAAAEGGHVGVRNRRTL